jgi:hypothetical protein
MSDVAINASEQRYVRSDVRSARSKPTRRTTNHNLRTVPNDRDCHVSLSESSQ